MIGSYRFDVAVLPPKYTAEDEEEMRRLVGEYNRLNREHDARLKPIAEAILAITSKYPRRTVAVPSRTTSAQDN